MKTSALSRLLLCLAVCSSLIACSNSKKNRIEPRYEALKAAEPLMPTIPPVKQARILKSSSTINVQDKLDIMVFKVPELSAQNVIVESSGIISMPFIGSLNVLGLTIQQAEDRIETMLSKDALQDPKVSITRTEQAFKRVTVEGAVQTPGVFPITGTMTFLQAIAMSQGITDLADTKNVVVFRDGKQYAVNLDSVRRGISSDPILKEDDRIVVLRSDRKVNEKKALEYLPALLSPLSLIL